MTEAYTRVPAPEIRESRLKDFGHEIIPSEVALLRQSAAKIGVELPQNLIGIQGGGILASAEEAEKSTGISDNPRAKALVMGKTHGSSEMNVAVHFPTNTEHAEFGANLYSYQGLLGEYLRHHWKPEKFGMNPLQGKVGGLKLDDGRYVTALRYRKHFETLGAEGKSGIHELDTSRISPEDLRQVVRVLNEVHVDSASFVQWAKQNGRDIPQVSWLNPSNPKYAMRGQEWWISPKQESDRSKELTTHAEHLSGLYKTIDASFDAPSEVSEMILNNINLFPHQNGTVDHPEHIADMVVVHGALHPRNVHIRRDGERMNITISGGDRAQGMGVKGQMIDWLVTSTAHSPEHQQALLEEFIRLNPSEKDRRGLAMSVLYRSLIEASWFESAGKHDIAQRLVKLSYDILRGNGIWRGVNSPISPLK